MLFTICTLNDVKLKIHKLTLIHPEEYLFLTLLNISRYWVSWVGHGMLVSCYFLFCRMAEFITIMVSVLFAPFVSAVVDLRKYLLIALKCVYIADECKMYRSLV